MNPRLKSVLAVVAGIVAAGIINFALEYVVSEKPPEGLDFNNREAVKAWIDTLPVSAFIMLLLTYFLGSVAGGYVTNLVARGTNYRPALITGAGLFVSNALNLIAIPHPIWFAITSSLLFFAGAWIGGRIARQQEAAQNA